jgi:hypothetical protein
VWVFKPVRKENKLNNNFFILLSMPQRSCRFVEINKKNILPRQLAGYPIR